MKFLLVVGLVLFLFGAIYDIQNVMLSALIIKCISYAIYAVKSIIDRKGDV